jgi:orotidine-5'-phosphate decarboxylase
VDYKLCGGLYLLCQSDVIRLDTKRLDIGTSLKGYTSGVRVHGLGFRIEGSGLWAYGCGSRVVVPGLWVQGCGFRVVVPGLRVQGCGFRVVVPGLWVQD